MKPILTLLLSTLLFLQAYSQDKLIVTYEMFTKMEAKALSVKTGENSISKQEIENALKDAMEKPSYYKLTLNQNESIYAYEERIDNTQKSEPGRIMISFGGRGKLYKNLSENLMLKETNSFGNDYLIKDTLENFAWKITKENKQILGQEVRKATATKDSTTIIEAWYAPKLSFKNGPEEYGGLPGLILQLTTTTTDEEGDMSQTYTAISMETGDDKTKIERPKKGKTISQKEFSDLMEEQSKKFQEMYKDGVDKD